MQKNKQRTPEELSAFKYIRQEINNFVIEEYGYYYLKPGQLNAHWLAVMPYKPELVEILLQKVSNILNQKMNSKNPVFMTHVITDIAYYLSQYANKNPDSINRNQTAKALKQKLKETNAVLQGKLNVTDLEKKERKKVATKQARQLHSQVKDLFREMQNDHKYHWSK